MPPTDYESKRQLELMQAVICAYITEEVAVTNAEDALEVAHRLHNAGFVMAAPSAEVERNLRLDRIEDRLSSLESWAGVPK